MATNDLFQVNLIPNQYGVYLDLARHMCIAIFLKWLVLLILTCKISYLKYFSLGRRVKRFDFGRADVDQICTQLAAVDWCALFLDLGIDYCVENFYIRECFDRFVPFYYSVDSENRQPWFDKELRNLDNIRTKSHTYMKGLEKIYI
jgi:hypothetical protein